MATLHVIDTHTLVWFLGNDPRLGPNADVILQNPASVLILPATALAETCWIVQRGQVPLSIANVLAVIDSDPRIVVYPLDRCVIERSNGLTTIGEMHDRQIVATALVLFDDGETVDLLTADANITASGVITVVW